MTTSKADTQHSLTREQKEAVGLLSIGTFLEYFDLMLYVHMAVLLNELFFPKYDPFTASLLSAFAFCSTYLLRPFGALIFGYIGDNIGRKHTLVITTFMMSFSGIIMANLPTYDQIGISAAWIITICRVIQGMSSMGEVTGAELYLSEMIKPSKRYACVSLMCVFATLGAMIALAVASCVTSFGLNWRIAFWFGAGIAFVGAVARTSLRETAEFVNAQKRMQTILKKTKINLDQQKQNLLVLQEKVKHKTTLSYFLIECTGPVWFCITYLYCSNILKENFNFSVEQIIHQNFLVASIEFIVSVVITKLVLTIHPLKILKIKAIIFAFFALLLPVLLTNVSNNVELIFIQIFIVVFAPTGFPASGVFYMHFPSLQRFTCTSMVFAVSRSLMYLITSFGVVILTKYFAHWGLLLLILPVIIGHAFGIWYFKNLELSTENYF